jgi:hypothetical protein
MIMTNQFRAAVMAELRGGEMTTPNQFRTAVMAELRGEVSYCLANAYELVKEEDNFLAKLFYNATGEDDPYPGACLDCESEKYREDGVRNKREVRKRYREMAKYDAFDAFLTERVKNLICEDNLGDVFSFL